MEKARWKWTGLWVLITVSIGVHSILSVKSFGFGPISSLEQGDSGRNETAFLSDTVPRSPIRRASSLQEFAIHNLWNFENEELGFYSNEEILDDFNAVELYSHDRATIVIDTINDEPTKVMRITHPAETVWDGFEMQVDLERDFEEVYLTYNFKFGDEFNSTEGGKMPGLSGLPKLPWPFVVPVEGHGFWAINMFKPGGRMISYHRDRTTGYVPWSVERYDYNPIYFLNGTWYNITQRLVINTIENGTAMANGIKELWVDGRMIFRIDNLKMMQDDDPTMRIDALLLSNFYGGDTDVYKPNSESYAYIDNIAVYTSPDDLVTGRRLHDPSAILETPFEITDRRVHFDQLITREGKISNREYGSYYSGCIDEAYLIDAGPGNTVTLSLDFFQVGSKDYLFIYDGNSSDSKLLKIIKGYFSGSGEVVESSGRYLFVRFSTNKYDHERGWEGTISMSQGELDVEAPSVPTGLTSTGRNVNTIDVSWNTSTDNRAVTGYRVFLNGVFNGSTTSRDYTLSQLLPSTTYQISVSAFDAASNESAKSTSITETTLDADVEPPTVPQGLAITGVTGSSIFLSWEPSLDNVSVEGYNIYLNGSRIGSSVSSDFAISGLSPNTDYTITVSAYDVVPNESAPSEPIIGTTVEADNIPPSIPTGLRAINISSNSIQITWNSSSDNVGVTGYKVFANGLLKGETADNSFNIRQLNPGITYNMAVSAYDAESNESDRSQVLTATTVNPDVSIDPTMPEVETVSVKKSASAVETVSRMQSLGHTELQDYGVLFTEDPAGIETGIIFYGEPGGDSVSHDQRLTSNLLAFYDFSEGQGNRVLDRSGNEDPLDLIINKQLNTYWLPGQGLEVTGNTMIYSQESPQRLINAISQSNEVTLEAWIKQAKLKQTGPARILTLSTGNSSRAFTIGHEGTITEFDYTVRLNTSDTEDENGLPEIMTEQGFFTLGLHHFIYSRDAGGKENIWVNGQLKYSGLRPGKLSDWGSDNRFALANEISEERPWNGIYYLVAIYDKAMKEPEVMQHYDAGFGNLHFVVNLESLQTNKSYYFSPFVRTDQGIVYGEVEDVMIRNVRDFTGSDSLEIAVVPNPSEGSFHFSFEDNSNESEEAFFRVVDMSGQVIYSEALDLGETLESYEKEFDLSDLMRSGIYTVILILGSKSKAERLVIYSN